MTNQGKKEKILIVEDDRDLLGLLQEYFVANGFRVVTACDGVEAGFKYNNEDFDVILSDIKMPKKDGIKLIHQILSNEKLKLKKLGLKYRPIIIVLTSGSPEDYENDRKTIGNIKILPKPFGPSELMTLIQQLIQRRDMSQAI